MTTGKGGVAWVTDNGANAQTLHVRYATQAEWTAAPFVPCQLAGTKFVTGSVTGLAGDEFATPDSQTPWSVTVIGTNIAGSQCLEGGFIRQDRQVGFIN